MEENILTSEDLKKNNLSAEDQDYIKKEMDEAMEETLEEIEYEIENNKELDEETKAIFNTEDINERVEAFKKYHPGDTRFE